MDQAAQGSLSELRWPDIQGISPSVLRSACPQNGANSSRSSASFPNQLSNVTSCGTHLERSTAGRGNRHNLQLIFSIHQRAHQGKQHVADPRVLEIRHGLDLGESGRRYVCHGRFILGFLLLIHNPNIDVDLLFKCGSGLCFPPALAGSFRIGKASPKSRGKSLTRL